MSLTCSSPEELEFGLMKRIALAAKEDGLQPHQWQHAASELVSWLQAMQARACWVVL